MIKIRCAKVEQCIHEPYGKLSSDPLIIFLSVRYFCFPECFKSDQSMTARTHRPLWFDQYHWYTVQVHLNHGWSQISYWIDYSFSTGTQPLLSILPSHYTKAHLSKEALHRICLHYPFSCPKLLHLLPFICSNCYAKCNIYWKCSFS